MPKVIFQGKNGLSNSIKNEDDKYSVGYLIDPFRDWGFLKPAVDGTTITGIDDGYVRDMASSNALLALTETKIWTINTTNNTATLAWTRPGSEVTHSLIRYSTKISGTLNANVIFYFYGNTGGLYNGTTFTDNWMGTTPAGAASVGTNIKPYIWQGYLMLGAGQYIHKFDGSNGDNGTLTSNWFDLGGNWSVNSFFSYYNYLGIVASNSQTGDCQILLLDGSSSTQAVKRISVPDTIRNSFNVNNDLFFHTNGFIKTLGDNGLYILKELTLENKNTAGSFYTYNVNDNYSDKLNNKIYFGSGYLGNQDVVFGFAQKDNNNPYILSQLYKPTGTNILKIKGINSLLFVASNTGGTYYLQYFSTGNGAATLKYPFKDFGQRVKINYVKYYFKALASGDSLTCGLDINYGTSKTLGKGTGNISYTKDGAVTSKKFSNLGFECHAFRPTIAWGAGGVAISKIVVDYSFISD